MLAIEDYDFRSANMIKECFINTNKYTLEFGKNTVVLTQNGSFYECYALFHETSVEDDSIENLPDREYIGSNIVAFSRITDLRIGEKDSYFMNIKENKKYKLAFAGFKTIYYEQYSLRMKAQGLSVVLIQQDKEGEGSTRSFLTSYSPGTCMAEQHSLNEIENVSNNISCIWIEEGMGKMKSTVIIGMANVDIYSGESTIMEYTTENIKSTTVYDQLEKYVSIYPPAECIFISRKTEAEITEITSYIKIHPKSFHNIDSSSKRAQNSAKQTYQDKLLEFVFNIDNVCTVYNEFYENSIATQAYCYLIDFMYEHNTAIITNLKRPIFANQSDNVILNNYTLQQLEVLPTDTQTNRYGSLMSMLNDTVTPMGRRYFLRTFTRPISCAIQLNKEYDITEFLLGSRDILGSLYGRLKKINDIDKIVRLLSFNKCTPKNIYSLYVNLVISAQICSVLQEHKALKDYITEDICRASLAIVRIAKFIKDTFDIKKCRDSSSKPDFDNMVLKSEVDYELSQAMLLRNKYFTRLKEIEDHFNSLLKTNLVKQHITDSGITYIQITKSKIEQLKSSLGSQFHDIKFSAYKSTNNYNINSEEINRCCDGLTESNKEVSFIVEKLYVKMLEVIKLDIPILMTLSSVLAKLDYAVNRAYAAIKYSYCRPEIRQSDASFIIAKQLRHPIIECILTKSFYIPNDIEIGKNGLLIYGCNSVGKSALTKSIGIAILMAQAGFYVPAAKFVFFPYTAIFTRLVNRDSIFDGLSTFMVEMLELRSILKYDDNRSLVLGDELCSGTTNPDAICIFMSALKDLMDKKCSFVFATHLHEIMQYEETKDLQRSNMLIKHLSVHYDEVLGKLVYDRKLRDGAGPNVYGLEVCKSINMPNPFLTNALALRNKYFTMSCSILEMEISKYNQEKILLRICEKCNDAFSTEVHHIYKQCTADQNGFIHVDGLVFHKNHPNNLMCVCEECHKDFHRKNGK